MRKRSCFMIGSAAIAALLAVCCAAGDEETSATSCAAHSIAAALSDNVVSSTVTCDGIVQEEHIEVWKQGEGGDFLLRDPSGEVLVGLAHHLGSTSSDDTKCVGFWRPTALRNGDRVRVTGQLHKNPGNDAALRPYCRQKPFYYAVSASEIVLLQENEADKNKN